MAALTSPVGITGINVSRRDSQEYLRLHQLEPYLEDAAVYALYADDDSTHEGVTPESRARLSTAGN